MKRILMALALFMLLTNHSSFAGVQDYEDIKADVKKMAILNKTGKMPAIDESLKGKLAKFMRSNKDTPLTDFEKIRVLREASVIIQLDLQRRYNAKSDDLDKKLKTKEDKDLYEISRHYIGRSIKTPKQRYLLCKGNETEAEKSLVRTWEIRQKVKDLSPNSPEFIKAYEEVLAGCKFDENVIWSLLATYRYLNQSDKYNALMLRIIKEDQVVYDYSGSVTDDIDSRFRNEYLRFLGHNWPIKEGALTKEQVELMGETALTKYQAAFSLKGLEDPNDIGGVVQPMIVLSTWLKHYKLDDLRDKFITKFFNDEVVIRDIKSTAETGQPAYQEHLDYLQKKGIIKTE